MLRGGGLFEIALTLDDVITSIRKCRVEVFSMYLPFSSSDPDSTPFSIICISSGLQVVEKLLQLICLSPAAEKDNSFGGTHVQI